MGFPDGWIASNIPKSRRPDGAPSIAVRIIRVTDKAFDNFAATGAEQNVVRPHSRTRLRRLGGCAEPLGHEHPNLHPYPIQLGRIPGEASPVWRCSPCHVFRRCVELMKRAAISPTTMAVRFVLCMTLSG